MCSQFDFVLKKAAIFKSIVCCCWTSRKSSTYYMIQIKLQVGRLVINRVVTPLNLYYTRPVATFVWINMQSFRNFLPLSLLFLLKFRTNAFSICWSRDLKYTSNMVCTYFRVLLVWTYFIVYKHDIYKRFKHKF